MIHSILKYSEFTCGVILLIFAVIQMIYKNKKFINFNLAGLYFCLSYVILILWAFKSGLILFLPWLIYSDLTMAFAIGPFVYFYIKMVLGRRRPSRSRYLLHFIPAGAVFSVIIIINFFDSSLIDYYRLKRPAYPVYNLNPVIRTIDIISNFYMLSYFVMTIKNIYELLEKRSHKSIKELRIIFYYMFFILLFTSMMLIAGITGNSVLNIAAIYLLTLSGLWYFIFSFRCPGFTQNAVREAKIIRYKNSLLGGIDPFAVLERLDDLMEEEKTYTDDGLTLQKLADQLMITPHQLSKILNTEKKMNFRTLVNSYRVGEAMRHMDEFQDKTILQIALESGFSSKSSFNSVFLKIAGRTPREYRESSKG